MQVVLYVIAKCLFPLSLWRKWSLKKQIDASTVLKTAGPVLDGFLTNWRVASCLVDLECFGNELIVIDSDEMSLKLLRDRGQEFVDFGPPGNRSDHRWMTLGNFANLLGKATPDLAMESALHFLVANLAQALQFIGRRDYDSAMSMLWDVREKESRASTEEEVTAFLESDGHNEKLWEQLRKDLHVI